MAGLPKSVQQKLILSDRDVELSKKCASYLQQIIKQNYQVWIPYHDAIERLLPGKKGSDNRFTRRLSSFIKIITLCNAHFRYKLKIKDTNEELVIADLQHDLEEALSLTFNLKGIPPYKLKIFTDIIVPLFQNKKHGLTTTEICTEYSNKFSKRISTENLRKTYLAQLVNDGLIDEETIKNRNNRYLYKPVFTDIDDLLLSPENQQENDNDAENKPQNSLTPDKFCSFLHHINYLVKKSYNKVPENWLDIQIMTFFNLRNEIEVFDEQGKHVCLQDFVEQYTKHVSLSQRSENANFNNYCSELFGTIKCIGAIEEKDVNTYRISSNSEDSEVSAEEQSKLNINQEDLTPKDQTKPSSYIEGRQLELPLEIQSLVLESLKKIVPPTSASSNTKVSKVSLVLGNYNSLDFEWDNETGILQAASFVDNLGNEKVYLKSELGSEVKLIEKIKEEIFNYDWSIGWNTTKTLDINDNINDNENNEESDYQDIKCDLGILHSRLEANNMDNFVECHKSGNFLYYSIPGLKHIDLLNQVYAKELVQTGVFHDIYRTHKLDEISKVFLGYGKYKNISGKDFLNLPIEEQRNYSLRDSQLVMNLSKYNNYEILDALYAISEVTALDFETVLQTEIGRWWAKIFDKMVENGECPAYTHSCGGKDDERHKGALVIPPIRGLYFNVENVDVASLYPAVAILFNLSYETVNCACCKDDPTARAKIDKSLFEGCKYINEHCWICKKKDGAFKTKLISMRQRRLEEKKRGNQAMQQALKILINGGYGVFGSKFFGYYNRMVAEWITTCGRYMLTKMQEIAKGLGFEIIYGDTDSLFLNKVPSKDDLAKFQEICARDLDIEVESKATYNKLILTTKKQYVGIGINEKGKEIFDIVGIASKRRDTYEFTHVILSSILNSIFKENSNPIPNLRKAMLDLQEGKVNLELLKISQVLRKDLDEYPEGKNTQIVEIARSIGAKKGDLIWHFDADEKQIGKSWTRIPEEIDIQKCKRKIWTSIEKILEAAGYPIEDLAKEFGINIVKKKSRRKSKSDGHNDTGLPVV